MTERVYGYGFHVAKKRGDLIERAKAEAWRRQSSFSCLVCDALEAYLKTCEACGGHGATEDDVCEVCGGTGREPIRRAEKEADDE